jgi:hypothetical protein
MTIVHTIRRAGPTVLVVALLIALALVAPAPRSVAAEPNDAYLMAHFTGEGPTGEQVYFSTSTDGLHWTDLNNSSPVLTSTVGERGVRDLSLVRSPSDDKFFLLGTDLRIANGKGWNVAMHAGSTSLVIWESTDLVNWSAPRLVDVAGAIPDAGCAWAPEAIWDPAIGKYVVYWATISPLNGVDKARIYYATTTDFRTFSEPKLYIDRPGTQGIIDTQIIEVENAVGGYKYVRASGDGQITIEGSNSILGTWTSLGNLSGIGLTGSQVEGPMIHQVNGSAKWTMWLDQYSSGGGYMPVSTTNLASPSSYTKLASSSYDLGTSHKRHGFVLPITQAELDALRAKWPSTPVNRLQSYNLPDRYARHANFDARIDANVSPARDGQWRIVPGLNGVSGTVSIESANYPGYYLRHAGFDLALVRNDGTAQFAADATYRQVAGLADASAASFQSYNYPDRYIRHYSYLLRLDPITTATGRADATFRVLTP